MSKQRVEAIAVREGRWWEIELPGLGTRTAARKLADVQAMAEEAAALWLDVEPDAIEVHVRTEIPEDVRTEWEAARAKAEHARTEEAEAAALSRTVVRKLRADGYTYSEAALLLGLSRQRAQQLATATEKTSV